MEVSLGVRQCMNELTKEILNQAADPLEASRLLRVVFDELVGSIDQDVPVTQITAKNAVLEVVDDTNSNLYRRYLEVEYHENDNGIQLIGEDLTGKTSRIVFLSNQALQKLHDLKGQGPDSPRCDDSHE